MVSSYLMIPGAVKPDKGDPPGGFIDFLQAHHMDIRHICFVIPIERYRMKRIRFPFMTHEELDDTFQWEKERLFRTKKEMLFDYEILEENDEGYELLAYACETEFLTGWKEAINREGGHIESFISESSLAAEFFSGRSGLIFKSSADGIFISFFRKGQWEDQKYIRKKEIPHTQEEIKSLIDPVCQAHGIKPSLYMKIDTSGNTDFDFFWKEAEAAYSFILTENPLISQAFSNKERDFLSVIFVLLRGIPSCRKKQIFFHLSKKERIRLAVYHIPVMRIMTGCVYLFFVFSVFSFEQAWTDMKKTEGVYQKQEKIREDMRIYKETRRKNEEVREEIIHLEEQSLHWEQKLAEAADILPPGIVFRSIKSEPPGIQIEGTAVRMADLMMLQKRISWIWEGNAVIASASQPAGSALISYSLRWNPSDLKDGKKKKIKESGKNERH